MSFKVKRLLVVGLSCALISTTGLAATPVPAWTIPLTHGRVFNLDAQRGHWVVINYWVTWCAACLAEMPMLRDFAAAHPSVRLISVTYEDITARSLHQFLGAHPLGYPVAHVNEQAIPRRFKPTWFGIHALPLTYVVAPDGTLAKRWVGELDRARLDAMVVSRKGQR
ncbi:MAG: TlpA disulfide reductase family protein [Rhodanobacter sp.]